MNFQMMVNDYLSVVPGILIAVVLLIVASMLAHYGRKYLIEFLVKTNFDDKLKAWGLARNDEESKAFLDTLGTLAYFVIFLLFVPFILNRLGLVGVVDPIYNMILKIFNYIPNVIAAALIIFVGNFFCSFVRQIVENVLVGFNVDRWYNKLTHQNNSSENSRQVAEVLAGGVYVLIFIPILTVALETLRIPTISQPIVEVLNSVMAAVPNIFVAVVLVLVGSFIAKLLSELLKSLLKTSGIDQYSKYLNFKGESQIEISTVSAQITRGMLLIFFIVEAISVLNLEVLNTIGQSIIAYIPDVISAALILAAGIIGSNILAAFLKEVSGSFIFGEIIRYAIIVLASFMTLDQLQFAPTIVNAAFVIILGAIAFAFTLAVGLGGKEFAAKQLEKLEASFNESNKNSDSNNKK